MKKIVLLFSIFTLVISAFGQDDISVYGERRKEFDERNKILDAWVRNSENQRDTYKSGLPTNNKLSKADIIKLTPPKEDFEKYTQFLKNRKTGIVKLLDLSNCDNRIVAANDTRCLEVPQIIGNGSLYSFSARSYLNLRAMDIRLEDEKFSVWYPLNYALFSELGDVPLETLNLTEEIRALKQFVITKDVSKIAAQKKHFEKGVNIGGRLFTGEATVQNETTYLLRSGKYQLMQRAFEETIVAFRVIRKDADGSVVLIWRKM